MNDELNGAIRNALERGFSIEQAVQSLINAGYNPVEVRESAKQFNQSATTLTSSVTVIAPSQVEKPKAKSILSFSKPFQQQPAQKPIQQVQQQPSQVQKVQSSPTNIEKQIRQMYPQMSSPIPSPIKSPEELNRERKQTIAISLAILILLLGIIMLVLMFNEELLNLVT